MIIWGQGGAYGAEGWKDFWLIDPFSSGSLICYVISSR